MQAYGPVTLRPIAEQDLELLRELLNNPDVSNTVVDYGFAVSSTQQKEWYEKIYPYENAIRFMVMTEGTTIGSIVFAKIDHENKTGEIGLKLLPEYQGRNFAYYAIYALLQYLFYERDMECAVIYHFNTNNKARLAMNKSQFQYEGVSRSVKYKNGRRLDLVYWSCSREQFEKNRKDKIGDDL